MSIKIHRAPLGEYLVSFGGLYVACFRTFDAAINWIEAAGWGPVSLPQESYPMNTTKHTPGPWEVAGDGVSVTMKDNGQHVVAVAKAPQWLTGEEAEANAALIAAAPELLEALKGLKSYLHKQALDPRTDYAHTEALLDLIAPAQDAIAKAEGRSHE